jgi:hypothetical protein
MFSWIPSTVQYHSRRSSKDVVILDAFLEPLNLGVIQNSAFSIHE